MIHPNANDMARVIIVEDQSVTRMVITHALNLSGYRADSAASGEEALQALALQTYDVMVLDLQLPHMSGEEVMKHVYQTYPDLQVIILTAHATLESAIDAVRLGAVDYMLKPCSIHDLARAIERALQMKVAQTHTQSLPQTLVENQPNSDEQGLLSLESSANLFYSGNIILDLDKRMVLIQNETDEHPQKHIIHLTDNEARLLLHFMQNPGQVHSCQDLANLALDYRISEQEAQEIIRPHISRLRRKIEIIPEHPQLIQTVRGKGYVYAPYLGATPIK